MTLQSVGFAQLTARNSDIFGMADQHEDIRSRVNGSLALLDSENASQELKDYIRSTFAMAGK